MEDSQTQMVSLLFSEMDGKAEEYYDFEKKISEVKLKDGREIAEKAYKKYSLYGLIPY